MANQYNNQRINPKSSEQPAKGSAKDIVTEEYSDEVIAAAADPQAVSTVYVPNQDSEQFP